MIKKLKELINIIFGVIIMLAIIVGLCTFCYAVGKIIIEDYYHYGIWRIILSLITGALVMTFTGVILEKYYYKTRIKNNREENKKL